MNLPAALGFKYLGNTTVSALWQYKHASTHALGPSVAATFTSGNLLGIYHVGVSVTDKCRDHDDSSSPNLP
jgi:hypothetical protein